MINWTPERDAELKRLWPLRSVTEIARLMGVTRNSIIGKSNRLNLQFSARGKAREVAADYPARTIFPSRVQSPLDAPMVLKPGGYQRKLGDRISKGPWRGLPIYSLTLEERATCPRSCAMWAGCYGNAMGYSKRMQHGRTLGRLIFIELAQLAHRHGAIAVRLHVLGDFPCEDYVAMWRNALDNFRALRLFGFTAWTPASRIGAAIEGMNRDYPERCAIRFSSREPGPMRAIVLPAGKAPGPGTILCPAETGLGRSCSSCGLCWAPAAFPKTIAFRMHGR